MDKPPKNTTEKAPVNIEESCAEIAELKEKRGGYELSHIKPEELTEKDAEMWQKYKSHTMTQADIIENSPYDKDVKKDIREPWYESRENLLAFFRQALTSSMLKEQQREHENSLNGNSNK